MFAVWTNRSTGQAWNGTAFATRTAANLILGAAATTFDSTGYASFAIPVGVLAVLYDVAMYAYAGSVPVVGDLAVLDIGQGGNNPADLLTPFTATSGATLQTSVNNIASGASVVNANNASGAAIPTLAQIWQDATSGHFTVANSIGKSLFTGLAPGDVTGGLVKNNAAMTPAAFVVAGSTSFNNVGQTTPPPVQPSLSGQ